MCLVLACIVSIDAACAGNPSPSGDPFIGEYDGVYKAKGRPDASAKGIVASEGPDLYRTAVSFQQGATAATAHEIELHGHAAGPRVLFYGVSKGARWNGELRDGALRLSRDYDSHFELAKVVRHSPTEGKKPPAGAIVLLPFEEGKKPDLAAWTNQEWEPQEDGSMQVKPGSGSNYTKQKFGDIQLHMEFNLPHMPQGFGQGRANSGIYVQDRYEVQILDSFSVVPAVGDCGSLYDIAVAQANACMPPGQWQTYDITFRAPRLKADGSVGEFARITVVHNGMTIHDDQVLERPTPGGKEEPIARDCFHLQDHGNHLRFRNIWLVESPAN